MYLEVGFWVCAGLVAYIYVGYPACVFLLSMILGRDVKRAMIQPTVTVVISAYNEESEIAATVVNKFDQEYPPDRLQVMVVSDGSTDRTDEIVGGLAQRYGDRLALVRQEPRQGKTQAMNLAIQYISSDIVVFADANSIYARDAIQQLVNNFADLSVGYVTGHMIYVNPEPKGVGAGSGWYMSFENELRKFEGRLGSIVGVDGGIDAIRRQYYVPMRADQLPDFILPLNVVEQGKRVLYEPRAEVFEVALSDPLKEFRMRVRVSLRAMWALYDKRSLLNPFRYPLFAFQLMGHKVLRYTSFLPLVGVLIFNGMVVRHHVLYVYIMVAQFMLYTLGILGHVFRQSSWFAGKALTPYYFIILNAACALAFWNFVRGRKIVLWSPRGGV